MQNVREKAFILPTVLLLSIAMFVIGLSLVQATASSASGLESQYTGQLAREAADGGVKYANYCYDKSNAQTWSSLGLGNLTQHTDCTGASNSLLPVSYQTTKNYRTSFSVGDLVPRANGALLVTSVGKVEQFAIGNTSLVLRTYTYTQKQLLYDQILKASKSASGSYKTCGIVSSALYCWGKNSVLSSTGEDFRGNLGDGTTTDTTKPVKVAQDNNILLGRTPTDVVSADYHSCAIADGDVYCWGNNQYGQLGNGVSPATLAYSSRPVAVIPSWTGSGRVIAIGADGSTTCAIINDGKIWCWGDNRSGVVGQNSTATQYYTTPQKVYDASNGVVNGLSSTYNATSMQTSGSTGYNICAVADGKAYCWGKNDQGQIGDGTTTDRYAPTAVSTSGVLSGKTVTAISLDGVHSGTYAYPHACAIASGGIYCWGDNNASAYGSPLSMMGNGDTTTDYYSSPIAVPTTGVLSGKTIVAVNVGERHTCVLSSDQNIYCWGANSVGEIGDGTFLDRSTPVQTSQAGALSSLKFSAIGGGSNRACGIANFKTYCWGNNNQGQIGDGTTTNRGVPTLSYFLQPSSKYFLF